MYNDFFINEGIFSNAFDSITYDFIDKPVAHLVGNLVGNNATDPNGYPRAANNYTGPSFPENRIQTYEAAKSIYDSLSAQEQKWLCPNGKFINSPYLVYRRVLAIYNPNKPGYGIPIAFCEMYEFSGHERQLELILAVRPEFRSGHAALQILNEAVYGVSHNPNYDTILIRVSKSNSPMINLMDNRNVWHKMNLPSNRIIRRSVGNSIEYLLNINVLGESTDIDIEADLFIEGTYFGKMPLTNEQFTGSGSTLRSKVKDVMKQDFKNSKKRSTAAKSILWNYIPTGCDEAILGNIKYNGGLKIICEEIRESLNNKHRQQAIDYLQKVYDNLSGPNGKNERFDQAAVKAIIADAKASIAILKNSTLKETVEDIIREAAQQPYKSYPNTYIGQKIVSGGESIERPLIKYIMGAERVNKNSEAFKQIQSDIKTRQTSAILYRVLMMPNVVLAMDTKELPASFKVFRAADVRAADKQPKIFIDVTGLLKLNNSIFICNKIDTLITYLTGALVQMLYYDPSKQLCNNAAITRPATVCFVKLFTGVIDELRVIGYAENQLKIKYATAIYFLTSLVGKPIENARSMAANILGINPKEAKAYDYFYSNSAMENLNTFVTDLCENFHLRGFGTDIMLDRWMFKYGKGTMYGLELYPCFLTMLTNAYCGAYVNNQKTIEKYCGKDMVTISTTIIRAGADIYSER